MNFGPSVFIIEVEEASGWRRLAEQRSLEAALMRARRFLTLRNARAARVLAPLDDGRVKVYRLDNPAVLLGEGRFAGIAGLRLPTHVENLSLGLVLGIVLMTTASVGGLISQLSL